MGLFTIFNPRSSRRVTRAPRRTRLEQVEDRRLMAADVLLGSVYLEESLSGEDNEPDVIQVSFVGGAPGTTLDRLVIDGDKTGNGASGGDIFFDTIVGGAGAFNAVGYAEVSSDGFTVTSVSVIDGGTRIVFEFEGFEAGEEFVFSIDVDEYGETRAGLTTNAFAEGGEFEGSVMTGEFSAPGFVDLTLEDVYFDDFDGNFAAAETAAGARLTQLPGDAYGDPSDPRVPVRTAGAVARAPQVELARISGYVYHDRDDDGLRETGEEAISGVTLELLNAAGQGTGVFTTTNSAGYYEFLNLVAGTYGVRETQPEGWFDGKDTAGSKGGVAGNDVITDAVLTWGDRAVDYNFGELLAGSISGRVTGHNGPDCDLENPDVLIEGVTIELLSADGAVLQSTRTDSQGRYQFTGLRPGEYRVRETQPLGYFDGAERVGTSGGVATNDLISAILLGSGVDAVQYDFCEHLGARLSGYVYHDRSNDGLRNTGEEPIAGVTLKLLLGDGTDTGRRAVTDSLGFYEFSNLDRGKYRVMEVHPEGWLDGRDTPGDRGGVADNPGDMISEIMLDFGDDAREYNFGELLPGSISGRVGAHRGPDCDFDSPEILLAGVTIRLLDADGNLLRTTQTDARGEYRFDALPPGAYQVAEEQPAGYFDGGERVGTAGGVLSDDLVSSILLGSDVDALRYDFCEHVGAGLSGYVYHDRDDDGQRDPGEEPIEGVVVKLLRGDGSDTGLRATTNSLGLYQFSNLDAGKYRVMEIHPEGWLDGRDTPGTEGGVADNPGDMIRDVMLDFGDDAREYNFGELLPGSIAGSVHWSPTGDCTDVESLRPIEGVVVELLDAGGLVVRTTTTDSLGKYRFDGLRPGVYSVRETQPGGFFDGSEEVGSLGGLATDNLISQIAVGSGLHGIDYVFCEAPPAALAGFVFVDGAPIFSTSGSIPGSVYDFKDGVRTPDDRPLAGVVMRLVHGLTAQPFYLLGPGERQDSAPDGFVGIETLPGFYPDGVFEVATDENGYYEFLGLPAGSYAVVQVGPTGLIDSIDTPGTTGGEAANPLRPGDNPVSVHRELFGNDVISRISLAAGDFSVENNFSEVETIQGWLPPPPPTPEPPFTPPTPITPGSGPSPLPPAIPGRPPEEIYGGSDVVGYTWHLSVVNAGQPREMREGQAAVRLVARSSASEWSGAERTERELAQARWRLLEGDDATPEAIELLFGSDDAIPVAGDWDGDGLTDVGVFIEGDWYLDLDGDGRWGAGDLWAQLGSQDDLPVTGDWDGDGKTDIGIYGPAWPRDPHAVAREPGMPDVANHPGPHGDKAKNVPPTEEDATSGARLLAKLRDALRGRRTDRIDHVFHYGVPGDAPVAGDWNGDGVRTIGVFRDGLWTLDSNGDGRLDETDREVRLGQTGDVPLVGDFDGDGVDDLGVYRHGRWLADADHDGALEELRLAATDRALAEGDGGKPVVGDWDGDGRDEPALMRPATESGGAEVRVSMRRAG